MFMLKKERKGFTLIELLATIVILVLVFSLCFVFVYDLFDNTDKMMDGITEKIILNAAEEYAIEFRNDSNWNEEKDNDGNYKFCITLDSLINYGYFTNNESEIIKYKDDFFVEMSVVNGVYNYKLIGVDDISSCRYMDKKTEIIDNGSSEVVIKEIENEKTLGNFKYNVKKINDKTFEFDVDFNIDFKIEETIKTIINPTYVMLIVDRSGSMEGTRFTNAKQASVTFSRKILEKVPDAKIGLILYESSASLVRDFSNSDLSSVNFGYASGGTNTAGAVLKAINAINSSVTEEDVNVFALLLFDGEPDSESALIASARNLKLIGSKLIVVGYDMEYVSSDLKEIATNDVNLCKNSDYEGYCYYDSKTANIEELFSNLSTTITENVKSTNVTDVNVILSSPVLSNGEKVFKILKDGEEIEKVEESISLDGLTESVVLSIDETYQLVVNDSFFDNCEENDICGDVMLNIQITLKDADGNSNTIDVSKEELPSFKVTLTESSKVN